MADQFTDPHNPRPQYDEDDTWIEHLEWRDRDEHDRRMERGSDLYVACVVCHEHPGKGVYGGKCRRCHEERRAEREAA